jgi:hypothetical protein
LLLETYLRAKSTEHYSKSQDVYEFTEEQLTALAEFVLTLLKRIFKLGSNKITRGRQNALQSACNYMVLDFVKKQSDNIGLSDVLEISSD